MKRIFLIAGGPSVADYDLQAFRSYGELAGVNDCGFLIPGVSTILTMDRLWTENRWDRIRELDKILIVRKSVWDRFNTKIEADLVQPPSGLMIKSIPMNHLETELSLNVHQLNGRNSGFCAFNWAVLQNPAEIYLFGFDMGAVNAKRHWHEPYPWSPDVTDRYRQWAKDFDQAKKVCDMLDIKVYNCSASSTITAFPRLRDQSAVLRRLEIA